MKRLVTGVFRQEALITIPDIPLNAMVNEKIFELSSGMFNAPVRTLLNLGDEPDLL